MPSSLLEIHNLFILVLLLAVAFAILQILKLSKKYQELKDSFDEDKNQLVIELNTLENKKQDLNQQLASLNLKYEQALAELKQLNLNLSEERRLKAVLENQYSLLNEANTQNKQRLNELLEEDDEIRQTNADLQALNAKLQANLNAQIEKEKQLQESYQRSYQTLENQLKVMGNDLVKTSANDLQKRSETNIGQIISPLKTQLEEFKKYLEHTQDTNNQKAGELQNRLDNLLNAQASLSKQANELTEALTSKNKSQGMWGELQLERVLDSSGLTKDKEYRREVVLRKKTGEIIGNRPDAIIDLPDNHCIIVDAKCSLTAYVRYINATDEKEKETALKEHLASLKAHVKELVAKDYSAFEDINSPSFVFMFVPIDAALTDGMQANPNLYDESARLGVYLVSPSTLIPALRVVSNLWVLSEQTEKIRQLAKSAQEIKKKFDGVVTAYSDLEKISKKFQDGLLTLKGRLFDGRDNLKTQLDRFDHNARAQIKESEGQTIDMVKDEPLELRGVQSLLPGLDK